MIVNKIDGPVILEIPADPASLFLARCLVERLAQRLGFVRQEVERLVLAVDEACTNVIRHAYANRHGERIVLRFTADAELLEICIRDYGKPADPLKLLPRDLGEVRPGGLGVHFIKAAMDEVHYEAPPEGGTLLRMLKRRTSHPESV